MKKQQFSDGNGGFVEVDKNSAVILTHIGYIKENIASIDLKVSGLGTEIKDIKGNLAETREELIRVKSDTKSNTDLRSWVMKSFVGSLITAFLGFICWMCGLFPGGAGS